MGNTFFRKAFGVPQITIEILPWVVSVPGRVDMKTLLPVGIQTKHSCKHFWKELSRTSSI
jgi:hypothetical protein